MNNDANNNTNTIAPTNTNINLNLLIKLNIISYLNGNNTLKIPLFKSNNLKLHKINTIILSGGGIGGLAHIGALQYLSTVIDLNNITTYVGTSVGGIICTLLCIGYKLNEIRDFVL